VTANGTTLYAVDYGTRDGLGRIVTKTETIQGETHVFGYSYYPTGALKDVTKDGNLTAHYEYDANGNRLVGPDLTASPVYDNQDRLLSYGNCTYTYKNDGSLQTKTCPDGTTTYDYDAFGNLRGATLPNGTAITYLIDGQNRRVGTKVNGVVLETLLYDDQFKRIGWYDGNGFLKAQVVFGLNYHPEYMIKYGVAYRFILDQVGSVRLVVNSSTAAIVERIDYDEFGNVLQDTGPGVQPFGFAGGALDADTGLVRFGWRDYTTTTGRWTALDPLLFRGGNANLFVYAHNDPINDSDPTGLSDKSGLTPGCTNTYDCCLRRHPGEPEACGGSPDDFKDKFKVDGPEQPKSIDPKDVKPTVECDPPPPATKPDEPPTGAYGVCIKTCRKFFRGAAFAACVAVCFAILGPGH